MKIQVNCYTTFKYLTLVGRVPERVAKHRQPDSFVKIIQHAKL